MHLDLYHSYQHLIFQLCFFGHISVLMFNSCLLFMQVFHIKIRIGSPYKQLLLYDLRTQLLNKRGTLHTPYPHPFQLPITSHRCCTSADHGAVFV